MPAAVITYNDMEKNIILKKQQTLTHTNKETQTPSFNYEMPMIMKIQRVVSH